MEFLDPTRLFKRAWLIGLAMLLGGAAALVFALLQPTSYVAKARLLVGPGISNTQPDLNVLRASGQLIQTYAELPLTEPFLQQIIDELELNLTTGELARRISVRPNPETQILTIEVTYPNAPQAQSIAGLIATKLVQISPSNPDSSAAQLRGQIATHVQEMETSIAETRQSIHLLQNDYQKALDLELLNPGPNISNQAIANQLSEFEQNADLIASAATQSAAGVNILEQLIANTNARIAWFEGELRPDLNPFTRKIISDQIQADRVHLSNLQQGVVELKRPIEGLPLDQFITTTQEQIQALQDSLDASLNFDFRRLQLDRISLAQSKLNQAQTIESNRQRLILQRISEERDRIYKVSLLNLENQQAILAALNQQQSNLSDMQNTLSVLYTSVQAADPNRVEIIELATPSASDAPLSLMVLVGALAGATLAVVGTLTIDYINNTVETSEQIINVCPVPVITIDDNRSIVQRLINGKQASAERAQKYQMLGMRLLFTGGEEETNKLVLVGPTDPAGEGGVVAAQMAMFMAKAGKRVVLVDANPDSPSVASYFNLGPRPGLSDFLASPSNRSYPIIALDRIPNLGLVPFGNAAVDPSFLASPQLLSQIQRMTERSDIVLVSMPDLHRPDALVMAAEARGAILVVTRSKTTEHELAEVVESLSMVGAKILAAVLKHAGGKPERADIPNIKGTVIAPAEFTHNRPAAADSTDSGVTS